MKKTTSVKTVKKVGKSKKSFIVIGLGRFGSSIAKNLDEMNCDILAVDNNEDVVAELANDVSKVVVADGTKEAVLKDLGAQSIDHAVVAIGDNLEASIKCVLALKNLGVKNITVRADQTSYKEIYEKLGATEVVIPEEASAYSLSHQILSDSILDYYLISEEYVMVKVSVEEGFEPKTLIDLDIRNNFNVNIVGVIRNDEFFIPKGTDQIIPNDIVSIVGTKKDVRRVDLFFNEK